MMKKIFVYLLTAAALFFALNLSGCSAQPPVEWTFPTECDSETGKQFSDIDGLYEISAGAKQYEEDIQLGENEMRLWDEGHLRMYIDSINYIPISDSEYYFIKSYIRDMSTFASYHEIYSLRETQLTLLGSYNTNFLEMVISDGKYLYFSADGVLKRLSFSGEEKTVFDGRLNFGDSTFDEAVQWSETSKISGQDNILTVSAVYIYLNTSDEISTVPKSYAFDINGI